LVRSKKKDEIEYYKGLVRELEAEIRSLKKQTAKNRTAEYELSELRDSYEASVKPIKPKAKGSTNEECTACARSKLIRVDIPRGYVLLCPICKNRKTIRE
jgi:hypothetical protein